WQKFRPRIVRQTLMISRYLPFSSKPGSCPESHCSHTIHARQETFSRKRGGGGSCTAHLATQKRSRVSVQACQLERGPVLLSPLLPNTRRTIAFRGPES